MCRTAGRERDPSAAGKMAYLSVPLLTLDGTSGTWVITTNPSILSMIALAQLFPFFLLLDLDYEQAWMVLFYKFISVKSYASKAALTDSKMY